MCVCACNVMFWLYAIEPMSFGQISNVKRTHERRSYLFKDASITRIIIITSYFFFQREFASTQAYAHTHTLYRKSSISMQIVSIDLKATKFVEPALSFCSHTHSFTHTHTHSLSLTLHAHIVFSFLFSFHNSAQFFFFFFFSSLCRYVIHQITRLNGRNSISLLFTASAQIVLQ